MKILFLTPWYPDEQKPNHGIFVRDQARLIAERHEVWVVSLKVDYSAFAFSSLSREDSVFDGMKETRIVVKKSLPVFNQLNFFVRVAIELRRIGHRLQPDLVHGNIGYPGAFCAWMMSSLLKVPYVVTEHTRITNNFRSAIHRRLTLFSMRRARRIIAVSRWLADEIFAVVGRKPVVIPNVIHFGKFPRVVKSPPTNEFQIGFLGGMDTPVKGLDILLRAIAALPRNFRLHIGGTGALIGQYKALARELGVEEVCVFYGAVRPEEVNDFMSRLHFLVSASRWETFGVAMVEALACGLPVVATDSGGPGEYITPHNGVLVPPEDSASLTEAIRTVMANYSSYDRERIREEVLSLFSRENFLQRIEAVYRDASRSELPETVL